jgi:hypothetical protein
MRQFSRYLVVTVLTLSLGLHWALLQSVAWVGMVWQYSQTATLGEAISKTFDGQHPCQLCKLVTEGKKSEKKQEAQQPLVKLDFFLVTSPVNLYPPGFQYRAQPPAELAAARSEIPPTPPPRALLG